MSHRLRRGLRPVAGTLALLATACADRARPVDLAIVDANVIPMDSERVLDHQTILVDSGRIVAVGPTPEVNAGGAAEVVEAHGAWVLPGLADMHGHLWSEQDLVLYVANGVTLVRNMWGSPMHLDLRARTQSGELLGPTIVTAGPLVDGDPPIWDGSAMVTTPDDARRVVADQHDAGYDFIKVYNRVPAAAVEALVRAADSLGMPVAGHVPDAITVEQAMRLGFASIEHLTGFRTATRPDGFAWPTTRAASATLGRRLASGELDWGEVVDPDRLRAVAELAAETGTWQDPTLVVNERIFTSRRQAASLMQRPGVGFMSPTAVASWNPDTDFRLQGFTDDQLEAMQTLFEVYRRQVAALHEAGVGILTGTDAPNPHVLYGFSIHEELALLHEAGLSRYEALVASTRAPAEFLGTPSDFGTVQPGRRADLFIASGNPLDDLSVLEHPVGVVLRGDWLPREELDSALEAVAQSYVAPSHWFEGASDLALDGDVDATAEYRMRFNDAEVGAVRIATGRTPDGQRAFAVQVVTAFAARTFSDCTGRYRPDGGFDRGHCTRTDSRGEETFDIARAASGVELRGTGASGDDLVGSSVSGGTVFVVLEGLAPGLATIVEHARATLERGGSLDATIAALDTQSGSARIVSETWTIERGPDRDGHSVIAGTARSPLGNYRFELEADGPTIVSGVFTYQMGVLRLDRVDG